MEGYEVIGSDNGKLGHVVALEGDFVIAEEGTLRKKRDATPPAFAHQDDGEQVVRLTVSKGLVEESPPLKNGELDPKAIAEHYGLDEPLPAVDPGSSAEPRGPRAGRVRAA